MPTQALRAERPAGRGGTVLAADHQSAPVYQDDSARRLRLTLVEGELEGADLQVLARAEQRFGAHIRVAADDYRQQSRHPLCRGRVRLARGLCVRAAQLPGSGDCILPR